MTIKLTGANKAAVLLLALEHDVAAHIFRGLDDAEIKEISQAMANLGKVDPETIKQVVMEFAHDMNATLSVIGNLTSTERFLRKVLGHDKVNALLEDIRGPMGRNIWDKLSKISPMMLIPFLRNEYPQTVALILTKINPSHAAKILAMMSKEFAFEVLKRMISMDIIKKDVLESVEKTLRTEFISDVTTSQKYGNNYIVAEVFNHFGKQSEEKFMEMLEGYNQDSAAKIKRLMFKFRDLLKIDTDGIQAIIRAVDKQTLIMSLKDAPEEISELFMNSMSQRAYKLMLEEIDALRNARKKDIEDARNILVTTAKDMANKGLIKLTYLEDEEDEEL